MACLTIALLQVSGCSADAIVAPVVEGDSAAVAVEAAVVSAKAVEDLRITAATDSSITVSWTEVSDGTGSPANYRVKYAEPPFNWRSATIGCERTIYGTAIGAHASCTIQGLSPGTTYEIRMMSYRVRNSSWVGAVYSNIATGTTTTPSHGVTDLSVVSVAETSLTLRWTQVDDGTGYPANYRLKYGAPPIDWPNATIGCDPSMQGTAIGESMSCTVAGLSPGTTYELQLMSYRSVDGAWVGAVYSNAATGATAASTAPLASSDGIWVSRSEVMTRPTSGPEWEALLTDAARDPGQANLSDMHSTHDVYTLAAALVCVRTGQYCAKARRGVLDAIGTEAGGRWIEISRNLGSYIIAADLLGLRADGNSGSDGTRVEQWVAGWLTKRLGDNIRDYLRPFGPFHASANAAAQEGFAYAAVAAYLRDDWALQRAWDAFRTYACDPTAPDRENIFLDKSVADGWAHSDVDPCAVNPAGTSKRVPSGLPGAGSVRRIDGALTGDMRRGGVYQWEPGHTNYPWIGLEGFVPAAVILERAGYPSFEVADRAVLRTHEYLLYVRRETGDARWFDGDRADEVVHIVNVRYGTSFPVNGAVGRGRTFGYTDWTHPRW